MRRPIRIIGLAALASTLAAVLASAAAAEAVIIENDALEWVYSSTEFVKTAALDASGGNTQVGYRSGDSAQIVLTGNRLQVFGAKFPGGKTAQLFIDDLEYPVANGDWVYTSHLPRQLIWNSDPLPDGEHTLKLVVRGGWIELDYFRVRMVLPLGPLSIQPEGGQVRISWPPGGVLQSVAQVGGEWKDVPDAGDGQVWVLPQGSAKFYRLRE